MTLENQQQLENTQVKLRDLEQLYAKRQNEPVGNTVTRALTLRSLKRNPGSEIRDEEMRKQFFVMMREHYDAPRRTPLLPSEQTQLVKGLEEVKVLTGMCGS